VTLKLAFTGTGYISKIHALAAQNMPEVELTAVVNHRPESMAEFAAKYAIPRQYATVADLLAAGQVDALIISTPNYLHAPETIAALNAGVHVMVEKPMGLNTREAEAMIEAGQTSGALLMVAHCWRFDEEVLWVKAQIDNNRIGPVTRTKGYGVHVHWGPGGWFTERQFAGGGALADMGIHAIDTARFLLGDPQPVSVYANIGTYYKKFDVDDTGVIIVNWDNGVTSYVESGWWQPHADGPEASTQLYGLKGMAHLFPTGLVLTTAQAKELDKVEPGFAPVRDPHCPQSMYDAQLAYFVDCIKNQTTPRPGGSEGLINMKIVDAAYESSSTGKVVEIS
jgi:predicted dehydrogenase